MNRPRAHLIYGAIDIAVAALYAYLILAVVPTRSTTIRVIILLVAALLGAGGVGMISGKTWGDKLAKLACVALLGGCFAIIIALCASAAYLHGIYDGIGQAGSAIALLCAALSIELVGLLPALQLSYLRRHQRQQAPEQPEQQQTPPQDEPQDETQGSDGAPQAA